MKNKYAEIKNKAISADLPDIRYAFGPKQYAEVIEYFANKGITKDQLRADSTGAIGTAAAFAERSKLYEDVNTQIINECTADEIYAYEWANHECGYTGEDDEALAIVHDFFPDYEPSRKLIKKLQNDYYECNC